MSSTSNLRAAAGGPMPLGTAVGALRESIRGRVIVPTDNEYDDARTVWNATIDRRPALIVRAHDVVDVRETVRFVLEQGLPISVRGGGHNAAGNAIVENGVVVDLRYMSHVTIDPVRRIATVGGGATLGDLDRAAQAYGLAYPVGVVSATGVSGLTLHGGMGFLTRAEGLTCDRIVGAELVTAVGEIIHATAESHPDLIWALRGGGGNFGVVTRLELELSEIGPDVWMAVVMYPLEIHRAAVRVLQDVLAGAGDAMSGIAVYWSTPHDEALAPENRGVPTIAVAACWSGAIEQGETIVQPLREIGTPLLDLSGPYPYLQAQCLFDPEYPPGQRHYWKSIFTDEISDEFLDTLALQANTRPSPMTSIDIWMLGGAMARTPAEHGAFAHRHRSYLIGYEANWTEAKDDTANIEWTRECYREVEAMAATGVYLNFPGADSEIAETVPAAYAGNYDRLRRVKQQYDPNNLFRSTLNIPPAGESRATKVAGKAEIGS